MSEQKTSTDGLMKIGELAKAANVNVSTLKFYVKEELIRPALKTGRNMSWYSPDCVATIRAIRMLQRERFYPLSVIKHLLSSSGAGSPPELALLDAIHKVDYRTTGCHLLSYRISAQNSNIRIVYHNFRYFHHSYQRNI